jgi:hypothetical protein
MGWFDELLLPSALQMGVFNPTGAADVVLVHPVDSYQGKKDKEDNAKHQRDCHCNTHEDLAILVSKRLAYMRFDLPWP